MKKSVLKSLVTVPTVIAIISTAACGSPSGPQPSPSPANDVVRAGDGIRLGSGWYPVERYHGLVFRWATNDAEITACPDANNRTLAILLERGPSLGTKAFTLHLRGNRGDNETAIVKPGQYVKIAVNPNAAAETFLLHADARNRPIPRDKRFLNYRALAIILGSSAGNCKNEIVFDGSPLALGNGWYSYETFNGQSFRWVKNNARVTLTAAQTRPFVIEAEVEPGPGLGGAPLQIAISDANGTKLAQSSPVKGSAYVGFHLPAEPAKTSLTFSVNSKNVKAAHEKRILNFRVFGLKIKP